MPNRFFNRPLQRVLVGLLAVLCGTGCGNVRKDSDDSRYNSFVCPRDKNLEPKVAMRMQNSALKGIWTTLSNQEQKHCWASAALAAGYIGTPEVFPRLRNFVESRSAGLAMSEDLHIVEQIFMAMGTIVRQAKSKQNAMAAIDFLIEKTDTASLERMTVNWGLDAVVRRDLIRSMSMAAVSALAEIAAPLPQTTNKELAAFQESNQRKAQERLKALAYESTSRTSYDYKSYDADENVMLIEGLFNIHALPPGRVVLAVQETLTDIVKQGGIKNSGTSNEEREQILKAQLEKLRQRANECYESEIAWVKGRHGSDTFKQELALAEEIADSRLDGLNGHLESLRNLLDSPDQLQAIDEISEIVFPNGPIPLIKLTGQEQVTEVLKNIEELLDEHQDSITRLGIDAHIKVVRDAHEDLRRTLESGETGVGFDKVIHQRALLQNELHIYLANVITYYPTANDAAVRQRLTRAFFDQDDQISNSLRSLSIIRDIDPKTGLEFNPLDLRDNKR